MKFEKWQALGNDYLIIESEQLPWELTPERIRAFCHPNFGPGGDGILLLSADPDHVAHLRIFNPDGSEAELSGNGAREAAMYLKARGWTESPEFTMRTAAGVVMMMITTMMMMLSMAMRVVMMMMVFSGNSISRETCSQAEILQGIFR